ncbi:hypothetical protein PS647_02491 [Pseudomonas fluorescens]|jgi:hypothetical protein|uniref:hypothetical protein n=1 Tax=Pseudomonas fluorescens TaxID=294 RepID=UPI00123F8452|nr:hypothetical protein [Pseudomonas fluorescens]VVM84556.1 hypothetical protein PS647_02491 [Pseudomonas fluorescens]
MAAFITVESKGRPQGAPEFLAYSPKISSQVRLYCRPSFWHWVATEFNPYATDVLANQRVLNLNDRKISVALQYELSTSTHFVFSKREVSGNAENEILEYAEKNNIQCEFLGAKCKLENQVHAENLLCMLSYINKFKESLSDRNLDSALRIVGRSEDTVRGAVLSLQEKFQENAGALLFELVRRGRIRVTEVQSKGISGTTKIQVVQVGRE